MPINLDNLPDNILRQIYVNLDDKSLKEIALTSKRHNNLTSSILNQRVNDTIKSFYNRLPTEIQSIVRASDFKTLYRDRQHPDLVTFLQNKKMSIDQLNTLAVTCYEMMWHFEHPSNPAPPVPQISESELREIDQDFYSIRNDNIFSWIKLLTGLMTAFLAFLFTHELVNMTYDDFFAENDIGFMFLFSYVISLMHLLMTHKSLNEGKTLQKKIDNMYNSTGSRYEYAQWLHSIYKEMTTEKHKLISLENMQARDALRNDSVRIAANICWGIYYSYFIAFPLSGLAPITAGILGICGSVTVSSKLVPGKEQEYLLCDIVSFLTIYAFTYFFLAYPIEANPPILETELSLYASTLYALPAFVIYNTLKIAIVKTPDLIHTLGETVNTVCPWLPTFTQNFRYDRLENDERELVVMEEGLGPVNQR